MKVEYVATCLVSASLLLASACSNSAPASAQTGDPLALQAPPVASSAQPAGGQAGIPLPFIGDPNLGGSASSLILEELAWGRLVDVFDTDSVTGEHRLVHSDAVILPHLVGNTSNYELRENLAQRSEFVIHADMGSGAFRQLLVSVTSNLPVVVDNGLPSTSQPPWTMVPRNAAFSVRFNDLLDASTVSSMNVKLFEELAGQSPEKLDVRMHIDRLHGALADPDGDGVRAFYSTRVVVDFTVDFVEAVNSNPPLAINVLGLPGSSSTLQGNIALRIPTRLAPQAGQTTLLANPVGSPLAPAGNGTIDNGSPTRDIVRTSRSGGDTPNTGDPQNGRLLDVIAPRLVGVEQVSVAGTIGMDDATDDGWILPSVTYNAPMCASAPSIGDTFEQNGFLGVIYDDGLYNQGTVVGLRVRALFHSLVRPVVGDAQLTSAFDPLADNQDCFVEYSPVAGTSPNRDVSPLAQVQIRFSEPIAADGVNAFEGFTIASVAGPTTAQERIAGEVVQSAGLDVATFLPAVPFLHFNGAVETYHVRAGNIPNMPLTDLAGNGLAASLSDASFALDPAAATGISGTLSLRFDTTDELGLDGLQELRGQFTYDLPAGELKPRAVSHFQGNADRTQSLPSVMVPFVSGVQTPLVPLGSKLQLVWRYADLGYSLLDEDFTNLDVEGLSWSPVGGQVIADLYPEFSIELGHAAYIPDEAINASSGFPLFPASGLTLVYADNFLEPGDVVHPKDRGYLVNPSDLYMASTGVPLMPFPLNEGVAPEDWQYSTWRDTALTSVGGPSGAGVPTVQEELVTGVSSGTYGAGSVPSIGLPLLTEIRCYPSSAAIGLNAFDISLAANSSARPNFRAFSSGGFNGTTDVSVDPDSTDVATGGFRSNGQVTPPADNSFHIGAVDFVTSTSRVHSIWFDTRVAAPVFGNPVLDVELPVGTRIELAFRGASALLGGAPQQPLFIGSDAAGLDPYGDPIADPSTGAPRFFNEDPSWKADISALDGARYLQVRISFTGNPLSNQTARLRGLALSWHD